MRDDKAPSTRTCKLTRNVDYLDTIAPEPKPPQPSKDEGLYLSQEDIDAFIPEFPKE